MVRERLTGEAPPAAVAPGMALIQDWIEEKVGADLDALGLAIDDQIAFADLSKKLLRDLDLTDGEMLPDDDDDGGSDDEGAEADGSDAGEEGEDAGEQGEGEGERGAGGKRGG